MKNNICPVCLESSDFDFLESFVGDGIKYNLFLCKKCEARFWEPFKNPGAGWYEQDERYQFRNLNPNLNPDWTHKKTISFFSPFSGDVLDAGCGTGHFLAYAEKKGWRAFGFDFDKGAISAGKNIFNLKNIEVNDLSGYYLKYGERKFDLITFFEVLEHLDNHNEFVEIAKKLLKHKGYVVISVPYAKMARWLNPHDLPPRHLVRWDENSLKNFLEKRNLKIVYIKKLPPKISYILMKIRFRFGNFFSFGLVKRQKNKIAPGGKMDVLLSKKIVFFQKLARIKDWILFGIPAILLWIVMFPTNKKYITLFVIAQKNE